MSNYSTKLKDPRWQKKRLQIMNRDKFKCKLCGDEETTLNVHHIEYTAEHIWDEPKENLITLCEHCHSEVESIKKSDAFICEFKDISIFKSNNWQSGSRIMNVYFLSHYLMRIYDKNNEYIIGFNLNIDTQISIKNILNKTIKFHNTNGQ